MELKNIKRCSKCGIKKTYSCFGKDKSRKDGLTYSCSECNNYYQKLKYSKYKELHNKYMKGWYENNKERHNKKSNQWRLDNHEKSLENQRNYRKNNLEKMRKYDNNWKKDKKKKDLNYKIKINLRERIRDGLKNNYKRGKVLELLGCSIEEYKLFLEKQFTPEMNWNNYGILWEIDHIIQLHTFDLTIIENQKLAFNYKNTRPLTIQQNRQRKKYE